eukprot:scaffold7264_cov75-Phaeocystis_antarctica.AAC.2
MCPVPTGGYRRRIFLRATDYNVLRLATGGSQPCPEVGGWREAPLDGEVVFENIHAILFALQAVQLIFDARIVTVGEAHGALASRKRLATHILRVPAGRLKYEHQVVGMRSQSVSQVFGIGGRVAGARDMVDSMRDRCELQPLDSLNQQRISNGWCGPQDVRGMIATPSAVFRVLGPHACQAVARIR